MRNAKKNVFEAGAYEQEAIELYNDITRRLIETGTSISTMESATSGTIATLLTDLEGASGITKGSFVTYSNEAKIKQGVTADIIEKYTVYSPETASAMAKAARQAYGADIGIGVTGNFGNIDPANPEASTPGTVYFAISYGDNCRNCKLKLKSGLGRHESKLIVAKAVGEELARIIMPAENLSSIFE